MENIRLDESLSGQEFVKSLTGNQTVSIDASNIVISAYGQVQSATSQPSGTYTQSPPASQAQNQATTADSGD